MLESKVKYLNQCCCYTSLADNTERERKHLCAPASLSGSEFYEKNSWYIFLCFLVHRVSRETVKFLGFQESWTYFLQVALFYKNTLFGVKNEKATKITYLLLAVLCGDNCSCCFYLWCSAGLCKIIVCSSFIQLFE